MPNLEDSIKDLESFKDKMKQSSEQTDDVKEGRSTAEEEQQEPAYVLYNAIVETSIEIMKLPSFVKGFNHIADKFGEDCAKELSEMMVIAMTQSAHNAILMYDSLLKEELTKQFDHYGKALNECIGIVNAHNSVLEVYKSKLGTIEKNIKLESMNKEANK